MKKRSIPIISLITLFSINLINAQFYSGYNRFSLSDLLRSIDPQTMILGSLFLIFFILIFYPLSRVFKNSYGQPNTTIAGVLAFVISTLIIYGIDRSGFDIEDLFYGIGLSSGILYIILPIILLIGAFFLIRWLGFAGFFLIAGLLLSLLTLFTEIFYEKGLVLIIGIVMFIIGIVWWWKKRGRYTAVGEGAVAAGKYIGSKYDWEKEKRQARWIGRGARRMVGREDPRIKLGRYERKRREAESKELAKRRMSDMRSQERQQKELAKRGLQEPKEEARRQEEEQMQQKLQQNEEARRQREYERSREEAYKEEARGQKIQQKLQKKEEAKRQKEMKKAHKEELKENQRIEEARRQELERQARRENYKRIKDEMRRAKER